MRKYPIFCLNWSEVGLRGFRKFHFPIIPLYPSTDFLENREILSSDILQNSHFRDIRPFATMNFPHYISPIHLLVSSIDSRLLQLAKHPRMSWLRHISSFILHMEPHFVFASMDSSVCTSLEIGKTAILLNDTWRKTMYIYLFFLDIWVLSRIR